MSLFRIRLAAARLALLAPACETRRHARFDADSLGRAFEAPEVGVPTPSAAPSSASTATAIAPSAPPPTSPTVVLRPGGRNAVRGDSGLALHLFIEASRRAYADRRSVGADPDFQPSDATRALLAKPIHPR